MSWWTAHAERELTEEVPAPPDVVRDFYVDLDNIKIVHPLIVSVEKISRTETPEGYRQSYRVVDRIPLGPLMIKITYTARLQVPVDGDVLTEADQSPGVRLRGTVSFEPTETGTRVTERIRFAAPRLLAAVTIREGVKAHIEMLAGIRRHFEAG
jgi:Polyketide cyclase / dehydrase and lipid transport